MYQVKIIDCSGSYKASSRFLMNLEAEINKWFTLNPNIKLIKLKRSGMIALIIYKVKVDKEDGI